MRSTSDGRSHQTRTYDRASCIVFSKTKEAFGGLSNMAAGFPLKINDIDIPTSEALYQACRFPHMPEVQRLIIRERSPMTAKMRGKPHREETRPDWAEVRVKVMRWCLRVKLAQNWQKFPSLLLATGDRPIVEGSRKDDFWGAKPIDEDRLTGMNVLGRLLMELREELRSSNAAALTRIDPLSIPNFLLCGAPIGVIEGPGHIAPAVPTCYPESQFGQEDLPLTDADRAAGGTTKPSPRIHLPTSNAPNNIGRREFSAIPKDCKRLAEVDFPIAEVSRHAAREKSIRHGHPSTLHLWWARRPLASCRAVLLGLLWPDPCDPLCPPAFKAEARERLRQVAGCNPGATDEELRRALLRFIADFANWDLASNRTYLEVSRALVKAAHGEEPPLVVDPFAGGGSIPLEALRVGCDAFASDLNPVACLILKVMLEDIPRHGPKLAEELRRVGAEIKKQAERDLAELYPKDLDGATPIAYLWARTVRCESPNCGAEIPLMRSFWLGKKARRRRALRYRVERPQDGPPRIVFEVFEPKAEKEVPAGTVTRAKATCLCCGVVFPPERVRAQLAAQRGGADAIFDAKGHRCGGARLLAVVTLRPGETGRHYRLPTGRDYEAVRKAQARVAKLLEEWERGGKQGLCPVPDEPTPTGGGSGAGRAFSVQRYGMLQWGDLFTARQKVALAVIGRQTSRIQKPAQQECAALAAGKLADFNSSVARWAVSRETSAATFGRQALPIVWDFCETVPIGDSTVSLAGALGYVQAFVEAFGTITKTPGQVEQVSATEHPLPDETAAVWFTDPPYYDAVPYADLSDFFFVWLKRALPGHSLLRDPFHRDNPLTPKRREAVQDETKRDNGRPKDRAWFEETMATAFAEGQRVLRGHGIGSVVFAHKTTEGWEALLGGMIRGGWTITGSWPIATERSVRLRSQESAALATSVHLICRPRPVDAPIGDWAEVLRELPKRVGDRMERLQGEGVRGADLVFACIGPALEIFSRCARVETADGREVKLDEYLEKVWEVVGRSALGQVLGTAEARARNGAAGAVEEDARLTALFLWTLQSTNGEVAENASDDDEDEEPADEEDEGPSRGKAKGFTLVFDVVRRFAQPLGIELPKWEGRVIETKKGVVRLLPIAERAKRLFGDEGAQAVAARLELGTATANPLQGLLFPEMDPAPRVRGRGARSRSGRMAAGLPDERLAAAPEATTLDRVHAAMLLQAGGRTNALRALLKAEQERSPDFLRLANALSALYPRGSEEKRLLDAMLLAVPR